MVAVPLACAYGTKPKLTMDIASTRKKTAVLRIGKKLRFEDLFLKVISIKIITFLHQCDEGKLCINFL